MEAACSLSPAVAMSWPAHEPENLRLECPRVILCYTLKGMEGGETELEKEMERWREKECD